MNLKDKSERKYWAREVAALAVNGEDTQHIWMRLDLDRAEVMEVYNLPEFEAAMREKGEDFWEVWSLTQEEEKGRNSIRQKILNNSTEYFDALHTIAMDSEARPETRAKILMDFLSSTKQLGSQGDSEGHISLSPASVKLINRGREVLDRHPVDYSISPHEDSDADQDE